MDNWEAETLNISGIVDDSIVDGPGLRYTIFVQGCPHGCPECHNPQTHSFEENKRVTLGQLMSEIKENPLLYGVTFSGGEPFCQPGPLAILGQQIKKAGMHLMCYSGYTYEQLLKRAETEPDVTALLNVVDVLVDGPFLIVERDLELLYRGSRNQRLIDLKGEVVGMKEMRGHGAWYIKGLPGSHPVKEQISRVETYAQLDEILRTYEDRIREWEQNAAQV